MDERVCADGSDAPSCAERRGATRIWLATLGVRMFGLGVTCYVFLLK